MAEQRRCKHCGDLFVPSGKPGPPQKYCSVKCRWREDNAKRQAREREHVNAKKAKRRCQQCGGPIAFEKSILTKFCSNKCAVQDRVKRDKNERAEKLRNRTCHECGGPLGNRPSHAKYCLDCAELREALYLSETRVRRLKRKYGLTPEDIDRILKVQNGCAICHRLDPGTGMGQWHIDHDHESMLIRGVLCEKCNRGLGHFDDEPERLKAAVSYVQKGTGWGVVRYEEAGDRKCVECGTSIVHKKRTAMYCSTKCRNLNANKSRDAKAAARAAEIKANRRCEQCGGPIPREAHLSAKYCSESCRVTATRKRRKERDQANAAKRKARKA